MLKEIFKRSFTRYLLSYIICLILPIIFFSIIYKDYYIVNYSNQLIRRAVESLDNVYEQIDIQVTNISSLSSQLLSSSPISDISLQENPPITNFYSIGDILCNYINTNEYIFDIWVFDKQNHCYFSPKHMFSISSFRKYGLTYANIPYKKFEEFLVASYYPIWIPENDIDIYNQHYPLITYINAYPNSSFANNSTLIFLLEESIFDQPIKSVTQWDQSTSLVIDSKGNTIYSMNHEMKPVVDTVITEHNIHDDGTTFFDINEQKYLVHVKNSTKNGLKYISIISYNELIADIQNFTQIFTIMMIIIILSGSALIFLLMKYNYNPISQLIKYSKKQLNIPSRQSFDISDIDQIRVAMEDIVDKNIFLVQYNEKYIQQRILFHLIKGGSDIDLNEVHQAGIDCDGNYNVVVIFRMVETTINDLDEFEMILNQAMAILSYSYKTYSVDYLEQHSFIVIFTYKENDPYFNHKISVLNQEMANITGSIVFAGIGNPCDDIRFISRSFTEAKTILRYQMNTDAENTMSFSDLSDDEVPDYLYSNLKTELNTLLDSIMDKNPAKIEFILSQLIDAVKSINTSYFFAICMCYDIINTILEGIYCIKGSAPELVKKYQSIFRQTSSYTVDDLINIITSLTEDIISYLDRGVKPDIGANYVAILQYIEENYRKSDFSVESIADHFGLSVSNLSHQFKAHSGNNISSYINTLKMKYAKELLLTTDFTINEIAAKLGYFQTSSFIRKFKQDENITPGEYRNSHRIDITGSSDRKIDSI